MTADAKPKRTPASKVPATISKAGKPMAKSRRQVIRKPTEHRISRKVRTAIDAMVWHGLKRHEAAEKAGLKDNSLYVALRKPDVKALYLAECEVLRLSGRARRIHRLEAIAEQDENKMAVVAASRALDNMGEDAAAAAGTSSQIRAGFLIMVAGTGQTLMPAGTARRGPIIEHEPAASDHETEDKSDTDT